MDGNKLTGKEHCAGAKRVSGQPAPRYCFVCGLGPCQYGYTKIQQAAQQGERMPNEPQHAHEMFEETQGPLKPHKMTFEVVKGEQGLWYITSPEWPGLLATGDTVIDALSNAGDCILELGLAHMLEPSSNPPYKPRS